MANNDYWQNNNNEEAALEYAAQNTDAQAALDYLENLDKPQPAIAVAVENASVDTTEQTRQPVVTAPANNNPAGLAAVLNNVVESAGAPVGNADGGNILQPILQPVGNADGGNILQPTLQPTTDSGLVPSVDPTAPPAGKVE